MKINIEYDTNTKNIVVRANGTVVENLERVEFMKSYMEDDKYYLELSTFERNESDDTVLLTQLVASEGKVVKRSHNRKDKGV